MNMKWLIFQSLGGLGMFLFGMKIMSEGLQKVAGNKMRRILKMVSDNRFVGCAVGTAVTSVIQSSSATTVMLVSFVDAGLMSLTQAVGVILGANIGTTVTAQLIAFNIEDYALPAIAAGVILKFFVKGRKWSYIGDVLLGFGLVFYGLTTMKAGFTFLKKDPIFISFFTKFQANDYTGIMICVLIGTLLTMILQSSSATVGITMALASQGLLDFPASVALVLGDNIGTTITAQLASIRTSVSARQTAMAHTLFNLVGVCYIILFFPYFVQCVSWVTHVFMDVGPPDHLIDGQKPNISRYVANSHTIFNVINALFFLLTLPYLVRAAIWLTPYKKKVKEQEELHHIRYIDSRFVDTPSVALGQARAEIVRMGEVVIMMYDDVIKSLSARDLSQFSKWKKQEDSVDILQREIIQFLVKVVQKPIIPEESKEVASLMRMANNLERTGDCIEDIAHLIEEMMEQSLQLSEGGLHDYQVISEEVRGFLAFVVEGIRQERLDIMVEAQEMVDRIYTMREEMRGNYLMRLQSGICTVDPGLILVDMLTAFEKMGGFSYNIAQAVAGVK
jgi:phosphate:Na+ symporter